MYQIFLSGDTTDIHFIHLVAIWGCELDWHQTEELDFVPMLILSWQITWKFQLIWWNQEQLLIIIKPDLEWMDLLDWQKIWSSAILFTSVLNELIGYSTWPLENNQNLFQTYLYMNKIAELHDFYLSRRSSVSWNWIWKLGHWSNYLPYPIDNEILFFQF